MLHKLSLAAALVAGSLATSASAATFDFADIANQYKFETASNTNNYEGDWETLSATDPSWFTEDGITIIDMQAGYFDGPADAFFDGNGGKTEPGKFSKPAGLGVCHTADVLGSVSGCSSNTGSSDADPGDDNATEGEYVDIFFDQAVKVLDLLFYNGSHNLLNGTVMVNFHEVEVVNGVLTAADYALINNGAATGFGPDVVSFDYVDSQFYVGSLTVAPIPLPAGVLLMGTALAGLGLARRRKQAA